MSYRGSGWHTAYETSGHLLLNQTKTTYERLALKLHPNRRDREGRWRMDGGVEEKEGGSEAGRGK